MSYIDIARFVREYLEKLERELMALSRKAPIASLRMALLAMAMEKSCAVEILRAIVRALDRYESLAMLSERLRRIGEEEVSREDLERMLTKLIELESYQREVPRLLDTLIQGVDLEIVRDVLSVLKKEEERIYNELKQLIESIELELGKTEEIEMKSK